MKIMYKNSVAGNIIEKGGGKHVVVGTFNNNVGIFVSRKSRRAQQKIFDYYYYCT